MSGLSERYVPEDEEEEADPPTPAARAPAAPTPTGDVDGWDGGFAADVQAQDPRSGVRCVASERRIRPVVEPPASELVEVDPRYVLSRSKRVLHRAAYEAYQRLKAEAEAAGLAPNLLKIISGYRSVAHQRRLWAEALKKYGSPQAARRWVAPPGGSPHHTGRAIDFFMGTQNSSGNIPALRATQAYAWLVCNASRFGFFPYANEPWHWEFNPAGGNGASGAPARERPSRVIPLAGGWDGFAADVQAQDPRSGVRCVASERRIRPVVEPPASELVDVDPRYVLSRSKRVLHRTAYAAYQRLKAAAEAAGLPANLLKIISGYRSVEHQRRLWAEALKKYGSPQAARRWVAPPGGSPHHTGRAIDFFMGTQNSSGNIPALRATQAYAWLVCNASRFGFFPYANEPWHWEFNPGGGARAGARLAEPPERGPILAALAPLTGPDVPPTVANALSLVKLISAYHGLPWRVGYTILEHEGGVRRFSHGDGVMQTTRSARNGTIPRIPRELKLVLLGRPASDPAPDGDLNRLLEAEFPRRLAVQIAIGVQELKTNLDRFGGYVSLALAAYNTGAGNVYGMVTGGQNRRPRGLSDAQWEDMCRRAATLYHQPAAGIRVSEGVWQCDANMPGWFKHFAVFDRSTGRQLRGFKYLRSFTGCIPGQKPGTACTWAVHGRAHRQPGSGAQVCKPSRFGSLDKLYDARYLDVPYRRAAGAELPPIPDDGRPLKAAGGQLVKTPASAAPSGP